MDGREPFNDHRKIGPIFRQKKHHEKQQSTSVTSTFCYMSSPPPDVTFGYIHNYKESIANKTEHIVHSYTVEQATLLRNAKKCSALLNISNQCKYQAMILLGNDMLSSANAWQY